MESTNSADAQKPKGKAVRRSNQSRVTLTICSGILKNSGQHASPDAHTSPLLEQSFERPGMSRELSEKEITHMNTNMNAGTSQRRNSSNPRGSMSRRQSGAAAAEGTDAASPRLKWDEANLYLNEGQMGGKMKIDEPKTPYAGHYDPADEMEEESSGLDANELIVDELDKAKTNNGESTQKKRSRGDDIPDLDLGEPEVKAGEGDVTDGERRVMVDADQMDVDGARHGEESADMTSEEREKHRRFEEMRKKHYEMKNVKNLLG